MRLFKVDLPYGLCQRGVDFCRWWNLDKRRLLCFGGKMEATGPWLSGRWKVKFEFKCLTIPGVISPFSWESLMLFCKPNDHCDGWGVLKTPFITYDTTCSYPTHRKQHLSGSQGQHGDLTSWLSREEMLGQISQHIFSQRLCMTAIRHLPDDKRRPHRGFKWKPIGRVGPLGYSCVSVVKVISRLTRAPSLQPVYSIKFNGDSANQRRAHFSCTI